MKKSNESHKAIEEFAFQNAKDEKDKAGLTMVPLGNIEPTKEEDYIGQLAAIVESSEDAIVSKSLDGIIRTWNRGCEKMFGYTSDQAIGNHISLIIPQKYAQEEKMIVERVRNNEIIDHYETMRNKKSGEQFFVSLTVSPLKDRLGNIVGVSKIARDITSRKKSEAELIRVNRELEKQAKELACSNELNRDLFQLSPEAMWVFELETCNFLDVNDAAIKNYGYSREEFLTTKTSEIIAREDLYYSKGDSFNSKEHDQSFIRDIVIHQKKDGELMHVIGQCNFILFNGKKAGLVSTQDVTVRIKYLAAIERQNKELQEIAWTQSHIVRAPLARMMAIVNLIRELKIASPECEDLLNHFNDSATELDIIIKDIAKKTACIKLN